MGRRVFDYTLVGNIYDLRFSITSVTGSRSNSRFPAEELRCIEVICLYSSVVIAVVHFCHPSRL